MLSQRLPYIPQCLSAESIVSWQQLWGKTKDTTGSTWGHTQAMELLSVYHHVKSWCCCPVAKLWPILCNPVNCSMPGFPTLHYLREFAQTRVHWVSHTIQTSPLSPPSPTVLNLSQHQGLLQWVSSSHQVARDWSFSFSISPSNEYSGLISFRIDWFDLLVVHGTLKCLLQCHNLNINSLALSLLYDPNLTSIHNYWTKT